MKTLKEILRESKNELDFHNHGIRSYKHGKATIQYGVPHHESGNKHIELHSIRVPKEHRNQGHSSSALEHFTKHADKHGKDIKLIASPLDKRGPNTDVLVKHYKKHGFELTGERANSAGDPFMVRKAR